MKASELIEILSQYPDREVILSTDSEGNVYSPAAGFSLQLYVPDNSWMGEVYLEELTDKLIAQGFTEEDMYTGSDGVKGLVLWPTN